MCVCPGWPTVGLRRMRKRQPVSVGEEHAKNVYEARTAKRSLTQPKAWGSTATGVLYKHTHTVHEQVLLTQTTETGNAQHTVLELSGGAKHEQRFTYI